MGILNVCENHTAICSTGATPYFLVYGMESVLPVKVETPSLRILEECKVSEFDWLRERYKELALINKKETIGLK